MCLFAVPRLLVLVHPAVVQRGPRKRWVYYWAYPAYNAVAAASHPLAGFLRAPAPGGRRAGCRHAVTPLPRRGTLRGYASKVGHAHPGYAAFCGAQTRFRWHALRTQRAGTRRVHTSV